MFNSNSPSNMRPDDNTQDINRNSFGMMPNVKIQDTTGRNTGANDIYGNIINGGFNSNNNRR